ncbi:hypothetical protein QBC45DRAFT_380411 [Copromyces sp. CBS 386.78]|nr:hypothetical protein QBC45DRAFT_380411 [Copromyces sp. CBS 386.78]
MNSPPSSDENPDNSQRGRQLKRPRIASESGTDNTNCYNDPPRAPRPRRHPSSPLLAAPFPPPPPASAPDAAEPVTSTTRASNPVTAASRGTRSPPIPIEEEEEEGEVTASASASAARFLRDPSSSRPPVRGSAPLPESRFPPPPAARPSNTAAPAGCSKLPPPQSASNDDQEEKREEECDMRARKFVSDLDERAKMAEHARLVREGRDPHSLQILENCCRESGYALRPFMCSMSTTDGFDYKMGMKTLPACLIEDKACWRALDMQRTGAKEGQKGKRRNFDVWVEKGYTKSVVLCVADRKNKCRGVMVRYRIADERAMKKEDMETEEEEEDGLDLHFSAPPVKDGSKSGSGGNENRNSNKWKEGVMGLKVIDFWRPGVADKQLQAALGDFTRDSFELLDDVKVFEMHGGAGPSMSGNVEYPVDAKMRRYLDMEEKVKGLAMKLGYEQVHEEQKPMGTRWVLEYRREALDKLNEAMDQLLMGMADEEMSKEEARKRHFVRAAKEDGKIIKEASVGGAKYLEDVRSAENALDNLMIIVAGQRSPVKTRNRDNGGYRPMPTLNLPVRNRESDEDGGLGKKVTFDLSSSGKEKSENTKPGVVFYSAASSPKSDDGEAILDSNADEEPSAVQVGEHTVDDEALDELFSSKDADEKDNHHLSGSQTPESKIVMVENVEVDSEETGSSLDGKKDVGTKGKTNGNNKDDKTNGNKTNGNNKDDKTDESKIPLNGKTNEKNAPQDDKTKEDNLAGDGKTNGANVGWALLNLVRANRTDSQDKDTEASNDEAEVD